MSWLVRVRLEATEVSGLLELRGSGFRFPPLKGAGVIVGPGVRVVPGDGVSVAAGLIVAGVELETAVDEIVREVSASTVSSQRSLRSPVVITVLHISLTSKIGWSLALLGYSLLGCSVVTDL